MPEPMNKRAQIAERDQRLEAAETSLKTELARVQTERQELAAELEAEAAAQAEAAKLAAVQGIPLDVARRRIEKERGGPDHGGDAAKMTAAEFAEHKRRVHGIG